MSCPQPSQGGRGIPGYDNLLLIATLFTFIACAVYLALKRTQITYLKT